MKKRGSVMAILAWIVSPLAADAATQNIPPSLYQVDGKPVPSSCLAGLSRDGDQDKVDLTHCGDPSVKPKTQPDGMVGYDDPKGGYFYYRYLGKADGLDVLYMEYSGGGTGHFTALIGITRNGQTLAPKHVYAGGDRCNGGLSDAALANGRLTFNQAITPYDLIALGDPGSKPEAYKDLEASASSCIGQSHMVGDDKHWTGVALDDDGRTDQKGWTEQYRYQSCFNMLYRETFAQHRTELDRDGVKAFAASFAKRCMQPK